MGEGLEGVVHGLEVQALEVGHIAWDVERHDLALALDRHLVAAGKAVKQKQETRSPSRTMS
jgi:hypothetical protein